MKSKKYRTADLYLDVALELFTSEKSDLIPDNNLIIFERSLTTETLRAVDKYNAGDQASVIAYATALKRRRAEMLIARRFLVDGGRS